MATVLVALTRDTDRPGGRHSEVGAVRPERPPDPIAPGKRHLTHPHCAPSRHHGERGERYNGPKPNYVFYGVYWGT